MGQICSICGFKEKPQQATANVESLLRGIQAYHDQSQQSHSSSPLVNMTTNLSSSADVIFFLYKVGAIVPLNVSHVRVDPSVAIIPNLAFDGRLQLKEVILPEGLTAIGAHAFDGCKSLERINLGLGFRLERINFPSTLTAIGQSAFYGCISLREVDLSNVITIGSGAFRRCNSLERINFPSTLTAISQSAFDGCTSLSEVDLSNVITVGNGAFCWCTALERINLPSTLTAIGQSAFDSCTSLREVKLVRGNLDIGVNAFNGCTSLREVKLAGGILYIGGWAFTGCSSLIRFQIPSKAFVIETGAYNCRLLTSGTITPTNDDGQVVIASMCLKYMSVTGLAEVKNRIDEITNNREQTRDVILRIRALFAHYELVEATTILELALWKAKVDEGDDLNAREDCRFTCGAAIIIPIVLPFL